VTISLVDLRVLCSVYIYIYIYIFIYIENVHVYTVYIHFCAVYLFIYDAVYIYIRENIHFYMVHSDRTLVVLLHKHFLFTPSPFFNSACIITICVYAAINKPNVTVYKGYPENKFR